jgi:hypothetical protein
MAQARKVSRGKRALPTTLPAPVGGLNGRDALGEQGEKDAFRLENWVPRGTSVDTRGGSLTYATGIGGAVESVEVYTGGTTPKMLAFGAGGIYNVTAGGAVGAALLASRVSNKVTTAMFSNAGSQFLLIYSGADQPLSYDGTTLTGLAITGLTGSQNTLFSPVAFKGRMFLAQVNQLGFYYLTVGAIQGAASFFDLQQQCLRGGSMAVITSFSQDTGQGPQDYALFVTTEGEYLVYGGTDPSNAATWALVARYYGPAPIGKKGSFKFRGDAYFITIEGIISFTEIRNGGEEDHNTDYLTDKLGSIFKDTVKYQDTHGWSALVYPRGSMVLVNVPLTASETGPYTQFVLCTVGKDAWTQFMGWNAICWTLFNGRAYYGTFDGKVILADEGYTDNGASINCICRQAWNTFDDQNGMGEADKQFHLVTFAMAADGAPSISANLNVNYEDSEPQSTTVLTPSAGADWDTADWDTADWAGGAVTQNISVPVGKFGYIASIWMKAVSVAATIKWYGSRIVLQKTNGVLLQ